MKNIHDHIDHVISNSEIRMDLDLDIDRTEDESTMINRWFRYYLEKLEMHNAMSPLIHIRSTAHPNG